MHRRVFLQSLTALATAAPKSPAKRPNIIIMMADDMGFSDLGCYGGEIRTPNIDSLAAGGARFTQFYNGARCCPTRASLLTGLYAHQAAVGHMVNDDHKPGYRGDLSPQSATIAEVLRTAGYRTAASGKWHVTPANGKKHNWPLQRGFERYFGTIQGAGSYYDPATLVSGNDYIQPSGPDFFYTDAIGAHAVKFIDEFAGQPFFLYVPFTSPHWPLHAVESDIAKYQGRYRQGWDALREERHARQLKLGIVDKKWPLTPRDEKVPAWKDAPHQAWEQRRMEVYAAQIDRMDQNVGRILAKLKEKGIERDTLILFLADNGGCAEEIAKALTPNPSIPMKTPDGRPVRRGNLPEVVPGPTDTYQSYGIGWANASNTPFRTYKHWVHEGGISSPLIAHWPAGITKPNAIYHSPGHLIDLMATCVDVAGAQYPRELAGRQIQPLEGLSLRPVWEKGQRPGHREIFWEHEGNRAVRQGKWKLVAKHKEPWELYDVAADRSELRNLAASQPAKTAELVAKYEAWAKRANVEPWPVSGKG
ncbi:MAG: arylsulfatase [Bryobacteraceae bacterium]|nr:arylsulfatase [Bryobacteraceae bacterium]